VLFGVYTPSCHFACSSLCFLVGCLVPFFVLHFVLFRVLLRAILRAPGRAFWCTPSFHFVCSSVRFLVYSLVPFCVYVFVFSGGATPGISPAVCWTHVEHLRCPDTQPLAHASIVVELSCFGRSRAIRQSYTRNSKNGALQGGLWLNYVKFGCFPRAPFCALFCAHCYSQ
jgi:hypothetical protein